MTNQISISALIICLAGLLASTPLKIHENLNEPAQLPTCTAKSEEDISHFVCTIYGPMEISEFNRLSIEQQCAITACTPLQTWEMTTP